MQAQYLLSGSADGVIILWVYDQRKTKVSFNIHSKLVFVQSI